MAVVPPRNFLTGTLNRFGVSSDSTGINGTMLMPKIKHRFRVEVYKFGDSISIVDFTRSIVSADRPTLQHGSTGIHSYNNIAYYANKPEWQTIEIKLRDDIYSNVSAMVSSQLQKQMNHYTQSAAESHMDYKFITRIQTLDGSMGYPDNVTEEWMLEGCFLENVAYDQFDYSSSDPMMISLTVRFDNATQGGEALSIFNPV